MIEIYLIRHGTTLWNREGRFQGHTDIALADAGIQQAELLRERLREIHFDAAYSSDLCRAMRTAEIVAEPHGLKVVPVPELREVQMGVWEGMLITDIKSQYSTEFQVWQEKPTKMQLQGFEGVENTARRVFGAFEKIVAKHCDGERIIMVGHGMTNSLILSIISNRNLDDCHGLLQGNTALNIIQYDGKGYQPILINCTNHCNNK